MMIHKAGAGPEPIPHKKLDANNLADAIKFALTPAAKAAAARLGEQIRSEVLKTLLSPLRISIQSRPGRRYEWGDVVLQASAITEYAVRPYEYRSLYRCILSSFSCDLDCSRVAVWWSTEHVSATWLSTQISSITVYTVSATEYIRRANFIRCTKTGHRDS